MYDAWHSAGNVYVGKVDGEQLVCTLVVKNRKREREEGTELESDTPIPPSNENDQQLMPTSNKTTASNGLLAIAHRVYRRFKRTSQMNEADGSKDGASSSQTLAVIRRQLGNVNLSDEELWAVHLLMHDLNLIEDSSGHNIQISKEISINTDSTVMTTRCPRIIMYAHIPAHTAIKVDTLFRALDSQMLGVCDAMLTCDNNPLKSTTTLSDSNVSTPPSEHQSARFTIAVSLQPVPLGETRVRANARS